MFFKKYPIFTTLSIVLISILSLFPPFKWELEPNNEALQYRIKNVHNFIIPYKKHDFIFNDITKEIKLNHTRIIVTRKLLIQDLLILYILSIVFSFVFQLLYNKYYIKFLLISILTFTNILFVMLITIYFESIASFFQPSYDKVKEEAEKLQKLYSINFENYYGDETVKTILFEITDGYYKNWSDKTIYFWRNIKSLYEPDLKSLYPVNYYLIKDTLKPPKKPKSEAEVFENLFSDEYRDFYEFNREKDYFLEDPSSNKLPHKYFSPPTGFTLNYKLLNEHLDSLKYLSFLINGKEIINYLKIKKKYYDDYKNFWNLIPKVKKFILIVILISVNVFYILFRKKLIKFFSTKINKENATLNYSYDST